MAPARVKDVVWLGLKRPYDLALKGEVGFEAVAIRSGAEESSLVPLPLLTRKRTSSIVVPQLVFQREEIFKAVIVGHELLLQTLLLLFRQVAEEITGHGFLVWFIAHND